MKSWIFALALLAVCPRILFAQAPIPVSYVAVAPLDTTNIDGARFLVDGVKLAEQAVGSITGASVNFTGTATLTPGAHTCEVSVFQTAEGREIKSDPMPCTVLRSTPNKPGSLSVTFQTQTQ